MEKYFMMWILLNYIFSMTILFITMLKQWNLFKFLSTILILTVGINLIVLVISLMIRTLNKKQKEENVIDMLIPSETEDEIKEILKEASQIDENEIENEDEFRDWTPEK